MGKLVELLGAGIGLASEALAARNSNKTATVAHSDTYDDLPPQHAQVSDQQDRRLITNDPVVLGDCTEQLRYGQQLHGGRSSGADEEAPREVDDEPWRRDDAVHGQTPAVDDDPKSQQTKQHIINAFIMRHPLPESSGNRPTPRAPLPFPVIIPQRRPKDKKRGFARAYAPVLQDCGIDQATFLDFLHVFHESSKADTWLNAVNVGAAAAGFAPSAIAMGVSISVQVTAGVAMEIQRRTRTNSFLDRMNNEFFKPRGLYCLIITYKPDSTAVHESIDVTKEISSSMTPTESKMKSLKQQLRLSAGATYGELELPPAAPLIFPAHEHVPTDSSEKGVRIHNKVENSQKFVADYLDRRAQAKFTADNQGSALTVPVSEKQFTSRFSDPDHPANSGSLISLLSGGMLGLRGRSRSSTDRSQRILGDRVATDRAPRRSEEKPGLVKRVVKNDVLYLMIVNLPSEEELYASANAFRTNKWHEPSG